MCHVLTVTRGAATDHQVPDLPAETFCACGALLVTEEETRWGACSACLDAPIDYDLTERGRRHADR